MFFLPRPNRVIPQTFSVFTKPSGKPFKDFLFCLTHRNASSYLRCFFGINELGYVRRYFGSFFPESLWVYDTSGEEFRMISG